MNAPNYSPPEPNDDPLLEEMLSPLKHLEPPLEARIANRQAVSAALRSFHVVNCHLPWWRRSISIPVPLAAALALLMAVAVYSSLRNREGRAVQLAKDATTIRNDATAGVKSTADPFPTWNYYETETYLCGVGRLNSESFYVIKD